MSARVFDGTGDGVIEIPDDTTLKPDTLTLSGWIKPDTDIATLARIFGKGNKPNGVDRDYHVGKQSTKAIFFFYDAVNTVHGWETTNTWNSLFPTTSFTHFSVSYSSGVAGSIKFYVNNVLQAGSWTFGNGNQPFSYRNTFLRIGSSAYTNALRELFKGEMEEVYIHNKALDADEVDALHTKQSLPDDISGLVLWLRFKAGTPVPPKTASWDKTRYIKTEHVRTKYTKSDWTETQDTKTNWSSDPSEID